MQTEDQSPYERLSEVHTAVRAMVLRYAPSADESFVDQQVMDIVGGWVLAKTYSARPASERQILKDLDKLENAIARLRQASAALHFDTKAVLTAARANRVRRERDPMATLDFEWNSKLSCLDDALEESVPGLLDAISAVRLEAERRLASSRRRNLRRPKDGGLSKYGLCLRLAYEALTGRLPVRDYDSGPWARFLDDIEAATGFAPSRDTVTKAAMYPSKEALFGPNFDWDFDDPTEIQANSDE